MDELITAAEQAGRGWAKEHALRLYTQALKLLPDGDSRRHSIRLRQVVTAQAYQHLVAGHVRPRSSDAG